MLPTYIHTAATIAHKLAAASCLGHNQNLIVVSSKDGPVKTFTCELFKMRLQKSRLELLAALQWFDVCLCRV